MPLQLQQQREGSATRREQGASTLGKTAKKQGRSQQISWRDVDLWTFACVYDAGHRIKLQRLASHSARTITWNGHTGNGIAALAHLSDQRT